MKRWMIGGVVLGVVATLTACAERPNDALSGPAATFSLQAVPACDLSGTNQPVSRYFGSTDAKTARTLIDQIGSAGAGSVTARERGFDLIALIAANAAAGTGGDASAASTLINKVTPCMFRDLAELPENFPEDYTVAVTTAAAGGLAVRGGTTDLTGPVLSRGGFSGVAPQPGVTWATTLSGNAAPARLVLYGRPGSTQKSYDWKVLPRNAAFNPPVIVGVCVDLDVAVTSMLHEEHVGVLAFAEATFLDPATCPTVSSRSGASYWTRQLAQVFLPRPLSASTVGVRGGVGGSTGGIGSEFSSNDIPNVNVTFTIQPPATVTVGETFSVQVRATDPTTGANLGGAQLAIIAVNNNGTPKELIGATPQTTKNDGLATFSGLSFSPSSTGGFRLVVGGGVLGRPSITVGQATSTKVNAKPAN